MFIFFHCIHIKERVEESATCL